MKTEIGTLIGNFKVERVRESSELSGRFVEMRHIRTGTELCWVDNGEKNKTFCVGFKTLPEDSTGVFHILEHSVLCGSEKYPVKEPFVDLMKSSMNTFLNAMTFQDKTIYPVSSRNERDFLNLTEVYLDAVFKPRCVVDPNAFRQEGWHLEIGEDGTPFFNGVVYNEMKGATSGIDEIMLSGMSRLIFKDTCNGWNSGGDPVHIPELTYEQYCAMYHKYYHPSNARIFLDGDVPLEKIVALIEEYIGGAEKQDALHEIPMEPAVPAEGTVYYEIGQDEDEKGRAMVAYGKIFGTWADKRRNMMTDILCDYLAETNESPLKRAILDAGLAEDVELTAMSDQSQEFITLAARNTDADKAQTIRETAEKVVKDLLETGLDHELLVGLLNRAAFRVKDMREPAGLIRTIVSYQSSLYGGDPMLYLENDADIEAIRAEIDNGGFEKLLSELLLDFGDMCLLKVLPSKTYGDQLRREEAERAAKMYAALTDAEKEQLKKDNDRLHEWQQQPDRPEDTATLPVLPLSEVSPEPLFTETEELEKGGTRVLFHAIPSNGIVHFNLYFSLTDMKAEELPAAGVMAKLMTKLPTKKHTASELQKEIKTYIGRLKFEVKATMKDKKTCTPYFTASFSCLETNIEKAYEIIAEILNETQYDDTKRIGEIMPQIDEETKQRAIMAGHTFGIHAVNSHYLSASVVMDATAGCSFRSYVKELAKDFAAGSDKLISLLERIGAESFVRSRLTIGVTAKELPCTKKLVEAFTEGTPNQAAVHYDSLVPERFGVRIPAQASFAEKGVDVDRVTGALKLAETIIGLNYLWARVRVQGGAYGVGLNANIRGTVCHYSYRDPSPARSIGVYGEESDYIRSFADGDEELTKYIISTIGGTEPLASPGEMGAAADIDYLDGRTVDDARKLRSEILGATKQDLLDLCPLLDRCRDEGCVCVVGSDSSLAAFDDLKIIDA